MTLSPAQDYIISRLKNADVLRYRDIKPDGISNDLYNYHLKTLVTQKLVTKSDAGYALSSEGIRYVADMHHTSDILQRLFKINVIVIVSRTTNKGVEILSQYRTAQPSYGKIGVPGGTIVKGEPILDGATRKLREETGLTASFRLLGHERRMQYRNGELFSDILFPICYADSYEGELTDTLFGSHEWVTIDQAIVNESDPLDSISAIVDVLQNLKMNNTITLPLFYKEVVQ